MANTPVTPTVVSKTDTLAAVTPAPTPTPTPAITPSESTKTPAPTANVAAAKAHLAKAKEFFSKEEWLKPGFNPFFALKKISELQEALDKSVVSDTIIAQAISFKLEAPDIKKMPSELYR